MSHDPIKRFWWFMYGFGLLCIALFGVYQARFIILGPKITIESPANGSTVTERLVTLKGSASNIKTLTVNGITLYTDDTGHFSERMLLFPGYNTVVVAAQDKFGNRLERRLELVVQLPDNSAHVVSWANNPYGKEDKASNEGTIGGEVTE
jgi:inosine/xanthosine triphosphate pyrophosphatase family protein